MENDQLIGLDWGTSSLRAYLLDAHGAIVEQLDAPAGVQRIERGQFLGAFETLCAPWLRARGDLPVVACGMIGSRQGWRET
ncbi:MAG: 2-dehydro-3-deoxygalactonokinase, partial [Burkholderiaceae bacterium]